MKTGMETVYIETDIEPASHGVTAWRRKPSPKLVTGVTAGIAGVVKAAKLGVGHAVARETTNTKGQQATRIGIPTL